MSEPFLGELKIAGFNFAPKGWALCNGQILPINQNQALFALLGTMYGGNGMTNFALPDLRGRTPFHAGWDFSQGQRGGAESHVLSISEMPAHTHIVNGATGTTATSNNPSNALIGQKGSSGRDLFADPSTVGPAMSSTTISATGGGAAHNNMQPYLVLNFVIALQGIFPSQN